MCDQRKVLGGSAHLIKKCIKKGNLVKCFDDTIARIIDSYLKMNGTEPVGTVHETPKRGSILNRDLR